MSDNSCCQVSTKQTAVSRSHRLNTLPTQLQLTLIQCRTTSKTLNKQSTIFELYITSMYKLSLHITCTRSVVKFSVPGGKYRTDFRYFRYLIVDIRYFPVLWIPTSRRCRYRYFKISDIGSVFRYTDPRLHQTDFSQQIINSVQSFLTTLRGLHVKVTLIWIPGHSEIYYNDIADLWAKKGDTWCWRDPYISCVIECVQKRW